MSRSEQLWLIAFTKTQLTELMVGAIILFVYSARQSNHPVNWFRCIAVIFTASAITHPLLWFVFPTWRRMLGLSYREYLLYGELIVFIIEGLWYLIMLKPVKRRLSAAFGFSLLLNALSYGVGAYLWRH